MATAADQGVVRITSDFGAETVIAGSAGAAQATNPVRLFSGGGGPAATALLNTVAAEIETNNTQEPSAAESAAATPPPAVVPKVVEAEPEPEVVASSSTDGGKALFAFSNPNKRRFSPYPSSTHSGDDEEADGEEAADEFDEADREEAEQQPDLNLQAQEPSQSNNQSLSGSVYNMFFGGGTSAAGANGAENAPQNAVDDASLAVSGGGTSGSVSPAASEPRDPEVERVRLLSRAFRLQNEGAQFTKDISSMSPEELRADIFRLEEDRDREQSVKFSRRLLLAVTSGLEFANERFNPVGLRLNGWSEHMMSGIEEYDPVLEKLHNKYNRKVEMPPEMEFISMIAGSALMFHLTSSIYRPEQPNMSRLAQENPEMMRAWAQQQGGASAPSNVSRGGSPRGVPSGGMPGMPGMPDMGSLGDILGMPGMATGAADGRSPFGLPSGRMAMMQPRDGTNSSVASEDPEDYQQQVDAPPPSVTEVAEEDDDAAGDESESVTVRTVGADGKRTMKFD